MAYRFISESDVTDIITMHKAGLRICQIADLTNHDRKTISKKLSTLGVRPTRSKRPADHMPQSKPCMFQSLLSMRFI